MSKMNKQQMVNFLKGAKVKDKDLASLIKEALTAFAKDQTKVLKSTLENLVEAVQQVQATPVEASLKKPNKAKKEAPKVEEPEVEETDEDEVEEEPVKEEKPAKKTTLKKGAKKAEKKPEAKVETLAPATNVGADHLPSAKIFPAEIDYPELGKLVACTGEYTTYEEVAKAILEEEKTLYFACYWTKRQIKEYGYNSLLLVEAPKAGFPYDLDMTMAVLPCETIDRIFTMSRITEALYRFDGEDFEYLKDKDENGNEFQIRVCAGMEFEIYRPADEE